MKIRKIIALALVAVLAFSTGITVSAASSDDLFIENERLIEYAYENIPDDIFGGLYLTEDGALVINVTENEKEQSANVYSSFSLTQENQVTFNTVKYSLKELEAMKDALVPYMLEYNIATLDANEVTNSVDIEMYENGGDIKQLVESIVIIDSGIVNIMTINYDIVSTVATEPAENPAFGPEIEKSERATTVVIYPGYNIQVGSNYCTAGPKTATNQFSTAGHAVTGMILYPDVKLNGNKIGTVYSYTFGTGGDRCAITVSDNGALPSTNSFTATSTGRYTFSTYPAVGTQIEMRGAYSGTTQGSVTASKVSVNVSGTIVNNMTQTNYTCQSGDSGAGVFTKNASTDASAKCYGIHSAGGGTPTSGIYSIGYFCATY